MRTEDQDNSQRQAMAQYESICDMVDALEFAENHSGEDITIGDEDGDWGNLDEDERETYQRLLESDYDADTLVNPESCRERIDQDPLSVEVRGDWHTPGDEDGDGPAEYRILLCTGGPAVQILGELDDHCEPKTARLMHQDWFNPWTEVIDGVDQDKLLRYARCFWFGE